MEDVLLTVGAIFLGSVFFAGWIYAVCQLIEDEQRIVKFFNDETCIYDNSPLSVDANYARIHGGVSHFRICNIAQRKHLGLK